MFIQPIDRMADAEVSMCNGCPDMRVHQGELVGSCGELKRHGGVLPCVPRAEPGGADEA